MGIVFGEFLHKDLGFGAVGACETDDEREFKVDSLGGSDDAFSQHVTFEDASEDIDQDALYLFMARQDLEGSDDLVHIGTSSYIEEVGRVASVHFDNVHGGHG